MWGIRFINSTICAWQRFIPTRVGNTRSARLAHRATPVHPHACGEYAETVVQGRPSNGSSARVWGIPDKRHLHDLQTRFIPTRVGNTACRASPAAIAPVHPHACGEYAAQGWCVLYVHGSSPRVWGIQPVFRTPAPGLRFIPTRVGNTQALHHTGRQSSVHPHACGEYADRTTLKETMPGSSPRVWGIPRSHWHTPCIARFIPTRVGNTRL